MPTTPSNARRPQVLASRFVISLEGAAMRRTLLIGFLACAALTACNNDQAQTNRTTIKVRGSEQERLHELDAFNLAIALKHAIYDAGYTCKRVTDGGYIGEYKNLDMWMAHCVYDNAPPRDW